jgi:hypothetical protein
MTSMTSNRLLAIVYMLIIILAFGGILQPISAYYDESGGTVAIEDVLIMSSIIGGTEYDVAYEVEIDAWGNIIVAGATRSSDFPINSSYPSTYGGLRDVVITKFSPYGSELFWSNYIGGTEPDDIGGMAVMNNGDVVVCGRTSSSDFPVTSGAYQSSLNGSSDGFVVRLDGQTGSIVSSTLLGGEDSEYITDMTLTTKGDPVICGSTDSQDYPTTEGALQKTHGGGYTDAFVSIVSADGKELLASTLLGKQEFDRFHGVAVDDWDNVYLTGTTYSDDFPTTDGAYDTVHLGYDEVIVCKLDHDLSTLLISTFLGTGRGHLERGQSIEIDTKGDIVIMGETDNEEFPVTDDAFKTTYGGDPSDVFIAKLSADGSSLLYCSYVGGNNTDVSDGFTLDDKGNAYIFGFTRSGDFPTTEEAFRTKGENDEAFICRIGFSEHTTDLCTLFGASDDEIGYGITHRTLGRVVVVGVTQSSDFPLVGGYNQTVVTGSGDFFVSEVDTDVTDPTAMAGHDQTIELGEQVRFDGRGSFDDFSIVNFTWSLDYDGETRVLYGPSHLFQFDQVGSFAVSLTVTDASGHTGHDTFNVTVLDKVPPVADAGRDLRVDQHENVTLDGSTSWDGDGIANYTWTFKYGGEQVRLHGRTPTFTFDLAGLYQVMLNVSDRSGNWATDIVNVTVNDITPPEILEDLSDAIATTGDHYTARIRVQDNIGVDLVTSGEHRWTAVDVDEHGNGVYKFETTIFDDIVGPFYIHVTLRDVSGNEHTYVVNTPDIVDNDLPRFSNYLTNKTAVKGIFFHFYTKVTDNVDPYNTSVYVEYSIGHGSLQNSSMERMGAFDELTCSHAIIVPRDAEGTITFRYVAVDATGNTNATEEIRAPIVNVAPEVAELPVWNVTESEDAEFDLTPYVSDLNDETITVTNTGDNVTVEGLVIKVRYDTWVPDHTVTLSISDGEDVTQANLTVHVVNVNDPPVIVERLPATGSKYKEGKKVVLSINVSDEDGDELNVTWWEGMELIGTGSPLEVKLKPGEHVITVVVNDGTDQVDDTFTVVVEKEEESPGFGLIVTFVVVVLAVLVVRRTR